MINIIKLTNKIKMYKILIKKPEEVQKMRIAGNLAAEVLEMIEQYVIPGITTAELDCLCHNYIVNEQKAISACLGYHGFPNSVCISVNEVVCHGIPKNTKVLKDGDIVNIDVSLIKNGYHSDTSKMFIVGKPTILGKRLCYVAQKSLYLAISIIKPGIRLNTIGSVIQKYVENQRFSVVRQYCGHGIGKKFHEYPQILHYHGDDQKIILKVGMTFTIEPMINAGHYSTITMKDGWTVKTTDCSLSAQYEHTVTVTKEGYEILTLRKNENIKDFLTNKEI